MELVGPHRGRSDCKAPTIKTWMIGTGRPDTTFGSVHGIAAAKKTSSTTHLRLNNRRAEGAKWQRQRRRSIPKLNEQGQICALRDQAMDEDIFLV